MDLIQSNLEDGLPISEPTSNKYSGEILVSVGYSNVHGLCCLETRFVRLA
jgi:hypothetical protein